MTVVRKTDQVSPDAGVLREAASIIRNGGTVVFPTETVYGLGANALSSEACDGIFRAKKRPADNPLIVHVDSMEQFREICIGVDRNLERSLSTIWPGPLTVLARSCGRIPDNVAAGLETVAVRMPANPVALGIIKLAGVPVAAPSANIATRPSIVDSSEAIEELDGRVDMIVDAGPTFFGIESTIINTLRHPVELMRPGAFDQDELAKHFGRVEISRNARGLSESSTAITPGMKYKHYSPDRDLYIMDTAEECDSRLKECIERGAVLIGSDEWISSRGGGISLGSGKDLYSIARNLFPSFRKLDKSGARCGIIQAFQERGVGLAIMNRIRKASSGTLDSCDGLDAICR